MIENLAFRNTTVKILWKMLNGQMPCLFQEITGLYCPGCGGTRAVKALLKGDLLTSFLYHPVILYSTLIALFLTVSCLIYRKTKNPKFRLYLENKYVYAGIGIIAVNFVVKNYVLLAKGIDILAELPPV